MQIKEERSNLMPLNILWSKLNETRKYALLPKPHVPFKSFLKELAKFKSSSDFLQGTPLRL
ncbi:hypothetical protein C5167_041805 [Papaver somniferum]|nr:hypothetical protein C5167_041805 [Papaver somniferum]